MRTSFYILFLLFSGTMVFSGCGNKCDRFIFPPLGYGAITLDFIGKENGKYLFQDISSRYNINDLKAYDENKQAIRLDWIPIHSAQSPNSQRYQLRFDLIEGNATEGYQGSRKVFLDLASDIDTLEFYYKVHFAECSYEFETMAVEYNGVVIARQSNDYKITAEIRK